jgi:EAL domain-containing protein (putative c-di-GMP-specific phosphodiesterase class I)
MSILKYALDEALKQGNLNILKQPIVRLAGYENGEILKHYEVLTSVTANLKHLYNISNLEILIHELERYKGTRYLDELVFKEVLAWMAERKRNGSIRKPLYHINVHPDTINFGDKNLTKRIQQVIALAGIDHKQICFEITENTFLKDVHVVQAMIAELRSMGCKVALDDFGRKMLNLSTLKVLRPDYVKIDGSYVINAKSSNFDRLAIKAIVELSNAVGAETVAEHIETEEDCRIVKDLGVDYGQGWYFARPIDIHSKVDDEIFLKGLNEVKGL